MNYNFSQFRVLRLLGLAFSTAGLAISMTGLFFPWFTGPASRNLNPTVIGLDFLTHGFLLAIISYIFAWIVYLIYCFKPNHVLLWAILFTIVFPIFYLDCWASLVALGWRSPAADILGRGGSTIDLHFSVKQGFWISLLGMSLLTLGIFMGMNARHWRLYLNALLGAIPILFIFPSFCAYPLSLMLLFLSLVGALIGLKIFY